MALKDIHNLQRYNVHTLKSQPLAEISGALGDLGTLLPLMIALALQGSISLPSTLVFSGFYNIATGVLFGIPLPVQPMKAIAAAAIASRASEDDTLAAGALVASAVLLLSATGLLRLLTVHIPVPVVKGIQLGAGLSLVISAGAGMLVPLGWDPRGDPFDNRTWALAAFLLLVSTARTPRRFPYALVVFTAGLVLSIVAIAATTAAAGDGGGGTLPGWEVWHPSTVIPAWGSAEAWSMAIAQLPLTTLNSVIAAAALASDLMGSPGSGFPGTTPSVTELGASVAAMNLVGCWFGAMPVCHGAGGLAAQWRFGARSGSSIILLGAVKLFLGLCFGETLLDLLGEFPRSVLGVMVIAAGLELAGVGRSLNHGASDLWEEEEAAVGVTPHSDDGGAEVTRAAQRRHRDLSDEERQERWTVMLVTTAGILAFKNDAVGFLAGMVTYWAYRLSHVVGEKHRGPGGSGEREPLLRLP